jgi:superfamily II DNA or RNA helicase
VILRDYQIRALEDVRSAFRSGAPGVLLVLPTGAGKTVVAAAMVQGAQALGRRALFCAHRRELVAQTSAKLAAIGVDHGVILAGEPGTDHAIQVASVQTLARRRVDPFDLVYVDEAHHVAADTYARILELARPRWTVGLTATPYRTDGRGLGDAFKAIVAGPDIRELTAAGWLVPADVYSPAPDAMLGAGHRAGDYTAEELEARIDRPALVGDLVATWQLRAPGLRTVAFGVSVEHAAHIVAAFRAARVPAELLTGETTPARRAELLEDLAAGRVLVVANCAVLTEGWDSPAVAAAIIARPTLSRGLWRQMAGRVLRQHPGKARAVILDQGANAMRHGHPYLEDPATLEQGPRRWRTNREQPPATVICAQCFGVYERAEAGPCPYCGAANRPKLRRLAQRAGELERVDWNTPRLAEHDDARALETARALTRKAWASGYKPGWIFTQLRLRYGADRARGLMAATRGAAA